MKTRTQQKNLVIDFWTLLIRNDAVFILTILNACKIRGTGPLFCNFRTRKSYKIRAILQNKGNILCIQDCQYENGIISDQKSSKIDRKIFCCVLVFIKKWKIFWKKKILEISEKVFQKKFFFVLKNTFKSSQHKKPKKNSFRSNQPTIFLRLADQPFFYLLISNSW